MKFVRLWKRMRDVSVKNILLNNFWLKLISLAMAIITWLYVNGELTQGIKI